MYKIKKSYYYLERGFPENLEPAFTNQSTKRKRLLIERKKRILKRSIRKSLRTLVKPFFSAPTKKGVLLEKLEKSFQDLFLQEKGGKSKRNSLLSQSKTSPFLQSKCRRYKFLFPLYRLKGELSKRESQYGKIELYKKQIQEKKKLAFIYGTMSKNSLKKLVRKASTLSSTGNPPTRGGLCASRGLVTLLESRLDVALFRASFFSSIPMARQWINHNKVAVNRRKMRAPGYQLRAGDCIEILPLSALPLKENQRGRVAKVLPFRRSRKKLVTPSLMRNWSSFETFFLSFFQRKKNQKNDFHAVDLQSHGERERGSLIKNKEILSNPTAIESFSLMKNHLQSVWEKSTNPSPQTQRIPFPSSLNKERAPLFSQPGPLSLNKEDKRNQGKISDQKPRKTPTSSTLIHSALRKGVALFGRLKRGELEPLDFLNAKQTLIQPRNRMQKLAGLQVSPMKPLHLEVSYRLLTAIFLYSPQKVAYPGNLDLPLIIRSFK